MPHIDRRWIDGLGERAVYLIEPSPRESRRPPDPDRDAPSGLDADAEDGPAATPAGQSRVGRGLRSSMPQRRPPHCACGVAAAGAPAAAPAGSRSRASGAARSALHAVTTSAAFRAAVPPDAEEGPATTPAGSRSRASDAARSALRAATTSAAFRGPAAIWPEDGPAATPPGAPALPRPSLPPVHCRKRRCRELSRRRGPGHLGGIPP